MCFSAVSPIVSLIRAEADFLERVLRPGPGAALLDVACGGGRHAVELAGRGYELTGVDYSGPFLDAARRLAADRGAAVAWERREMRDLPWPGRFDAASRCGDCLRDGLQCRRDRAGWQAGTVTRARWADRRLGRQLFHR